MFIDQIIFFSATQLVETICSFHIHYITVEYCNTLIDLAYIPIYTVLWSRSESKIRGYSYIWQACSLWLVNNK